MSEVEELRAEVARLRSRVRLLRDGEPSAQGLGYVFVVTYGRSGSTLLMGLLNSIPGYLVRGENWDALHHLFEFHRTLEDGSRKWDRARLRQRTHPFYGAGDFPV